MSSSSASNNGKVVALTEYGLRDYSNGGVGEFPDTEMIVYQNGTEDLWRSKEPGDTRLYELKQAEGSDPGPEYAVVHGRWQDSGEHHRVVDNADVDLFTPLESGTTNAEPGSRLYSVESFANVNVIQQRCHGRREDRTPLGLMFTSEKGVSKPPDSEWVTSRDGILSQELPLSQLHPDDSKVYKVSENQARLGRHGHNFYMTFKAPNGNGTNDFCTFLPLDKNDTSIASPETATEGESTLPPTPTDSEGGFELVDPVSTGAT